MKLIITLQFILIITAFCDERARHVRLLEPENEASDYEWLPVFLTEAELDLLEQRSNPPSSALDFYLLLSRSYFGRVEDSMERRISFIDRETLTPQYLHAEFTIPRVDAGAFFVTIRIFEGEDSPLIAVRHRDDYQLIYKRSSESTDNLSHIRVGFPELWTFKDGAWVRANHEMLPRIQAKRVITRYEQYRGHMEHPSQTKYISLDYELAIEGNLINVTGRENFMSPRREYIWATFKFDGTRFVQQTRSEQHEALKP